MTSSPILSAVMPASLTALRYTIPLSITLATAPVVLRETSSPRTPTYPVSVIADDAVATG